MLLHKLLKIILNLQVDISLVCLFLLELYSDFLGIYDKLVKFFGGGASVVIMSFGNTLYNGAVKLGILNMLGNVSTGIVSSILCAAIITLIFKVKN